MITIHWAILVLIILAVIWVSMRIGFFLARFGIALVLYEEELRRDLTDKERTEIFRKLIMREK